MANEERNWKRVDDGEGLGEINFIRPSKLTDEDVDSVLVEGTFVESMPNNYIKDKLDFKFQTEAGIAVLNGAGNLQYKMRNVNPGEIIQVVYLGKQEMQKGPFKGKSAHNFDVFRGE